MQLPAAITGALVLLLSSAASALPQSAGRQLSGSIAGRVTLGGKPFEGAWVTLSGKGTGPSNSTLPSVTTDADGRFRLGPVAAGTY